MRPKSHIIASVVAIALVIVAASYSNIQAAPHSGEQFTYQQPNGEEFKVRLYGDEFFAYQETEDGYLVVRDPKTGEFCYARVVANGSKIASTGVRVGGNKPPGLKPKQRLAPGKAMSLSIPKRNLLGADSKGRPNTGKKLILKDGGEIINIQPEGGDVSAAPDGEDPPIAPAPPSSQTVGSRVGLVLLAYFPDRPGDVTKSVQDIDNYCNAETYTDNGNATSIYKYFDIQSNGKLSYKCTVTAWFEAANPRSYYTDNTIGYGTRARDLIREGLAALKADGFDFTQCDGDGNGQLDGVNIFYAGSRVNSWSEGIWPHKSSSSWTGLSGTGLSSTSYQYQITDMPSSLTIGTFCHENGHMICGYPDLYSYDGNAANMGGYSLMASSGSTHPRHVDPYLKIHAGWADVVDITSSSSLRGAVQQDRNFFYRYRNPAESREYFLFEVRGNEGYEGPWGGAGSTNPGDGLVVFHALENGRNTTSSIRTADDPADYTTPFELMVVEASPGTSANPWYKDPTPGSNDAYYSGGISSVSDSTSPALKFWASDGRTTTSNANIHTISGRGETMTFICGSGSPPASPVTGVTVTQLDPRVDYGENANSTSFAVFNQAGGTVNYNITDDANWLSCSPSSGSASTGANLITVTYNTAALSAGNYSATITVNGGSAGTVNIPVNLSVYTEAVLAADPNSFSLAGVSGLPGPSDFFNLSNTGGGTASYTVTKTQSWLTLDRTSGTVATEQDRIDFSVDATGLAPGNYNDTITISAPSASNSPLTIPVSFSVGDADMILTAPAGGETWYIGNSYDITWASTLGGNVKIELFKGGSLDTTIAASTPNDNSFSWAVPGGQTLGSDYKIRVTSLSNPSKTDESFTNFTIGEDLLALALDTTGMSWSSSGVAEWFRQTSTTHDGVDAAQSGSITHSESSSMEVTFTEEGTLTFWWKVSSENNYDWLELHINGVLQTGSNTRISGTVDWVQKTVAIPAGTTTARWTYVKDGSVDSGSNAAWVDQVVFTPNVPSYTVTYNANGSTGGGEPSSQTKYQGTNLILATNSGNLVKTGFAFDGWNTQANGNGTDYAEGGTYTNDADITLYAKWASVPTYTVTFNGNGNTGGSVPSSQTKTQGVNLNLRSNTGNLVRNGYGFVGWNTQSNGNGTSYAEGANFSTDANTTLYAEWNQSPTTGAGDDQSVNLISGGGPWTPADIITQLWLDADDASTITLNGSSVTQWDDKSGNNRDASQGSAGAQPTRTVAGLNGKNVLTFDGGSDYLGLGTGLDFLAGTSHSAFIVTKTTAYTDIYGAANASSGANSLHVGFRNNTSFRMNYWGNDWYGSFSPEFVLNEANLLNYVWLPGTSKEIFANATSQGTSSNAGTIGAMAGEGRIGQVVNHGFYGGDIAEIIMVTGGISPEDKERFEGYLAHKWGMEDKLPGTHLYKSEAPGGSGLSIDVDLSSANITDPEDDSTTATWSVVSTVPSGLEGNVSFDNVNLVDATATFTAEGVYTLRLTANDAYSTSIDEVVITVGPAATAYEIWTGGTFSKTFSVIDANSDPDGDGRLNFVEFAFGTDPTASDSSPMSYVSNGDVTAAGQPILEGPGGGYKAVFTRRKDHAAAGLTYTVEFSCDLGLWTSSAAGLSVVTGDPSAGDYEAVSVPFPATVPLQGGGNDAPKFFRVSVSMD